jgi:hypothetical protein
MIDDLLKMVFDDEILEKQDITALGLCPQTLRQYMLERVESAYRKNAACTGTYLVDLPKSFDKGQYGAGLGHPQRWMSPYGNGEVIQLGSLERVQKTKRDESILTISGTGGIDREDKIDKIGRTARTGR